MAGAALRFLRGARVQRVDVPRAGLLCLTLYLDRTRHHLLAPFDGGGLPHLATERPRGDAAGGLAQGLRRHLVGTRLDEASWRGAEGKATEALWLSLQGPRPAALCVWLQARCANLVCLDARGRAIIVADAGRFRRCGGSLGKPWEAPPEAADAPFPDTPEAWAATGTEQAAPVTSGRERARLQALRDVRKHLARAARKVAAIEGDLARADQAEALRAKAQLVLCHLDAIPPGAAEASLPALTEGLPPVRLELDPALGPLANAERWFARARRYERGAPIARQRLEAAREAHRRLSMREQALSDTDCDPALLPATEPTGPGPGPGAAPPPPPRPRARPRRPYRAFASEPPFRVWVGRSAADNDTLTLRHTRPTDLWLHVRDSPGAHVVVPLDRGQSCPDRVRLDAALLAAHFSPQAGETQVDVSVCERRHVRKRRGTPPGSVQIDRERVLALRADPARVRWLLDREQTP